MVIVHSGLNATYSITERRPTMKQLTEMQTRKISGGWLLKWYKGRCKICGYETPWTSEGAARYYTHSHVQGRHHKFFASLYMKISTKYEWR